MVRENAVTQAHGSCLLRVISVAEKGRAVYGGSLREHQGFSAPVLPVFPAGETSRKKKNGCSCTVFTQVTSLRIEEGREFCHFSL